MGRYARDEAHGVRGRGSGRAAGQGGPRGREGRGAGRAGRAGRAGSRSACVIGGGVGTGPLGVGIADAGCAGVAPPYPPAIFSGVLYSKNHIFPSTWESWPIKTPGHG